MEQLKTSSFRAQVIQFCPSALLITHATETIKTVLPEFQDIKKILSKYNVSQQESVRQGTACTTVASVDPEISNLKAVSPRIS